MQGEFPGVIRSSKRVALHIEGFCLAVKIGDAKWREATVSELSDRQREAIGKYLDQFGDRLRHELSDEGWKKERQDRSSLYRGLLGLESIQTLSESGFREVMKSLWALQIWTNKDWKVDDVLGRNGLSRIKQGLTLLLHGEGLVAERYDRCRQLIRGLGASSITEILCFVYPERYPIWNDKPKNVLPLLGIKMLLPDRVYKYQIRGEDYQRCTDVLSLVRDEMRRYDLGKVDFLDVDILMWLLYSEVVKKLPRRPTVVAPDVVPTEPRRPEIDSAEIDHWDAMGLLLELGNLLGYDTYTSDPSKECRVLGKALGEIARVRQLPAFTYERHLDTVRNIDTIWFSEEFPSHCFEVEHTTGVTSGLLRLYQIRNFTKAKFFIVSPADIVSRYRSQIAKDPFYSIRHRYNFRTYDELILFYEEAKRYHRLSEQFLCTPGA